MISNAIKEFRLVFEKARIVSLSVRTNRGSVGAACE